MTRRFGLYVITGGIGFIVDFIVYVLLLTQAGVPVFLSRAIAFIFAVHITFLVNSRVTFNDRKGNRNYYIIGQVCGAIINYISFIVFFIYILPGEIYIAFFAGSMIALLFNFVLANSWSFKET